ncbi:MAG: 2-amino-4-hydroxy-6-hydroxymethyldihydropteridine diphosphokinase [Timaviella obliquedivisa GSE-PSE-MK23-08B]|jgi:2-amino-4-hydroxy-6-hydroxymethyldihydropteridine diphosphokinase|nr:2-amino-4-hydroxy-6-hydroxymethyldihydropteridine diphosphokinase [Timaviella obliquedivisa GSE-PSE-MK23-08B]
MLIHRAAIALGSNLGDSCQILTSALETLDCLPSIRVEAVSDLYQTVAVGPPQPDYLNACAVLSTSLEPQGLLDTLLEVEAQFGRVRRERWGARLLDLDLLLFEDWVVEQTGLQIPHPRMVERAFVLIPLADVAANWVEPISGKAIAFLVQQLDCSGVQKIPLLLCPSVKSHPNF